MRNILSLQYGSSNDTNPYIVHPLNTSYHDTHTFPINFSGSNHNIFLSLNIHSLMANFNCLSELIIDFANKGLNLIAIALQETWSVPYHDVVHIPGFNFVIKHRSQGRGGGVCFYIKETINYKTIDLLSASIDKEFECLAVELNIAGKKTLLCNLYRSPSSILNNFIPRLDDYLQSLFNYNHNSFVFTDANINLLKLNNNTLISDYLDTVHSNGFLQTLTKATRISGDSYSLIDHILCSNYLNTFITGTVVLDISDHFMNFICTPSSCKKTNAKAPPKMSRNFSLTNMTNFRNDLNNISWAEVVNEPDTDRCFDIFWDVFSTLFELHFPFRKCVRNKNLFSINDFMTQGLLTSRRRKLELHKQSIINPAVYLKQYQSYRNIFNSLVRLSKKLFYDSSFKKFSNNPKKTWDLLNELTSNTNKNRTINIPKLVTENSTLTSPTEIANEFNRFFTEAGQKISDNVAVTSTPPESYLPEDISSIPLFELGNTGPIHISDVIRSFPNKASLDSDGISLKLIKFVHIQVSVPLAHIFNQSFESGTFPRRLKINRTVPILKSGDPNLCDNYRPISLIPTLSKIIEKMVAVRLTNHLQLNKLLHKHQFGFQRNLSTEHYLTHVINYIGNALNKGNTV